MCGSTKPARATRGAGLTAYELGKHGVPHTVIVDNAGGHLMQHGSVDLCIVGADRVTRTGDAANKIGTYLKALAAHDNGVPFWVAVPGTTIDWNVADGVRDIPIEERPATEVTTVTGARHGWLGRHRAHRAQRQPGREPRLRCNPGTIADRAHYRTRNMRGDRHRSARSVSGTGASTGRLTAGPALSRDGAERGTKPSEAATHP